MSWLRSPRSWERTCMRLDRSRRERCMRFRWRKASSLATSSLESWQRPRSDRFLLAEASETAVIANGSFSWGECFEALLEMSEEVVERFGESRVGKNGVEENRVGQIAHHGQLQHGHDFATFNAEDRGA